MPRTPAVRKTPARKTPARGVAVTTPASSKAPATPGSTTRKARLEEKSELQGLNKRLEFYILKQREKDASSGSIQRTITENKDYYEKEIAKMKALHETQVTVFRKQRDDKDSEIEKLTEENKRQAGMLKSVSAQLNSEKSGKDSHIAELTEDLLAAQAETAAAKQEAKKLSHDLKNAANATNTAVADLEAAQKRANKQGDELAAAQSRAKQLQEDLAKLSQQAADSLSKSEAEAIVLSTRTTVEDELRAIFGAQLKEIMAERQAQFEEDKNEGLQELKQSYEAKLAAAQNKCESLVDALEEAHKAAAEAASKPQVVNGPEDAAVKVWENRIEALQTQLAAQRSQTDQAAANVARDHAKEVAALQAEITVLEDQSTSASSLGSQVATFKEEVKFLKAERTRLLSETKDLKKELAAADGQARKLKALEAQVEFLSEQCANHKQEFKDLNEEYVNLMDVKVGLDMEIREFRRLLSGEEFRLQPEEDEEVDPVEAEEEEEEEEMVVAPVSARKKRGRAAAVTPAPKAKRAKATTGKKGKKAAVIEEEDEPAKPTLIISDMDSKKWIEITNSVKESVSLDGWSLKVMSSKQSFFFPDVAPLKPNKSIKVNLGSKAKKGKGTVVWAEDNIFQEADKVYLMSPEGIGHSSVAWDE